jgi:hypothetical protein
VRTRKGRALKPVATNANAKSGVKAKVVKRAVAAKPVAVAVRATRRGRPPKQKQRQQAEEEPPSQRQRQQKQGRGTSTTTKSASSAGATRAGAEQQHENEHEQQDANPPLVSTGKTASAVPLEPSAAAESSARTEHSSYQNGVPDNIDERDADDPLSVTDYVEDMYEHFRSKEEISSVDCMYMGRADEGKQPNINESMRCILVDWLIEVHYKFKLFPETLYLTVNILDRFLSQTLESITKRDLQLVGVTSLLVAAKYEEMYVPELRDLTYICDGAYTEARVRSIILYSVLSFNAVMGLFVALEFRLSHIPFLNHFHCTHTDSADGRENTQDAQLQRHRPDTPHLSHSVSQGGPRRQAHGPARLLSPRRNPA